MKKLITAVLMLSMTLLFAGCGSESTTSTPPPAENGTPAKDTGSTPAKDTGATPASDSGNSSAADGDWVKLGKSVDFQEGLYTVNAVQKSKGSLFTAEDGNSFVMIDMELKNNSQEEMAVSSIMLFELTDSAGNLYDISIGGLVNLDEYQIPSMDGGVLPGQVMKGGLAYEVPDSAKGLKLTILSLWGDEEATIELE